MEVNFSELFKTFLVRSVSWDGVQRCT